MKARVIMSDGLFVPQTKTNHWYSDWEFIRKPGYCMLHEEFKTLEEALDALRKSKENGKVVWEGELSEL